MFLYNDHFSKNFHLCFSYFEYPGTRVLEKFLFEYSSIWMSSSLDSLSSTQTHRPFFNNGYLLLFDNGSLISLVSIHFNFKIKKALSQSYERNFVLKKDWTIVLNSLTVHCFNLDYTVSYDLHRNIFLSMILGII